MSRYPALLQINTRALLSELADTLQRHATLDDIPDATLDRIASDGFDWVWPLGVWQTGEAARRVSLDQERAAAPPVPGILRIAQAPVVADPRHAR